MTSRPTENFAPPRQPGVLVHILAGVFLLSGSAGCLLLAIQQQIGGLFILFLLLSILLFAPLPLIIYRGYALWNAYYILERDGLRIRWGLRAEDIPLPEIEWVRPASDLGFNLPRPIFSWPGALLGNRQTNELGPIEYLASDLDTLILVATPAKVYAISPSDPRAFMRSFQYAVELGSISPIPAFSARPVALARRVWDDRPARIFLMIGLVLTLLLLIQVSLIVPTRSSISLGFTAQGLPQEPVPAAQLLLLPVLGILAFLADLGGGLYFYRREAFRPVAFLLWISSAFTPLFLMIAVFFLL